MRFPLSTCMALAALFPLAVGVGSARADEPKKKVPAEGPPTPQQARKAVERGLAFLEEDVTKWRKVHRCSTCHHGVMTSWALSEAKNHGYPVTAERIADLAKWNKPQHFYRVDEPRRAPGEFDRVVRWGALYLAVIAEVVPKQEIVTADELKRIVRHLLRYQEANGSWDRSIQPDDNNKPPFFESDEVVTLLGYLALGPHVPVDPKEKSETRESREKAAAWLAKGKPSDTTQAAALRLLVKVRAGESAKTLQPEIDEFLGRQNRDGGWSPVKDLHSDAYATGQALYFLSLAGVKNDRAEIQRGVSFLVANQKEDGSWPMTPRAHPGKKPVKNAVPIIYFGSAWATLGLMRSVSK